MSNDPKFTPSEISQIKQAAKKLEEQREAWSKDKLVVFEELLKLPAFIEWAKDNLVINREVSHVNREVMITVIYKGEYEGNKTSLQKLGEIDAVLSGPEPSEDRLMKIREILDYEVESQEPGEEEETDGTSN
jgi:hypothetical protein